MIAIKFVRGSVRLFCALAIVISFTANGREPPNIEQMESWSKLSVRDYCISNLDELLDFSMGNIPQFRNIHVALEWTLNNLPDVIKFAFVRAGIVVNGEMNQQVLAALSGYHEKFEHYLYRSIYAESMQIEPYAQLGCGGSTYDILANQLESRLKLSGGKLSSQFRSLGLEDSYDIQNVFMYMLVLEATDLKWNLNWFAR